MFSSLRRRSVDCRGNWGFLWAHLGLVGALCVGVLSSRPARAQTDDAPVEDTKPPQIVHEPCDFYKKGRKFEVMARFFDDSAIFDPKVMYRRKGHPNWRAAPFARVPGTDDFTAVLRGNHLRGRVEYFIEAYDENGNGPARFGSVDVPLVLKPSRKAQTCEQIIETTPVETFARLMFADRINAVAGAAKQDIGLTAKHLAKGEHQQALEALTRAYEVEPLAELLFLMAQCHSALGNHEGAMFYFEGFMAKRPDSDRFAEAEKRLARAREALAAQQAAEENDVAAASPGSDPEPAAPGDEQLDAPAEVETLAATSPTLGGGSPSGSTSLKVEESPAVYERWWFWTAIGGAAVLAGTGVALGVTFGQPATVVLPSGSMGVVDRR